MLLELGKIINCPGESVSFSTVVDLSDLKYGNCYPVTSPVLAEGTVRNTAGVLEMSGSIRTTIHGVCDRCAEEFTRDEDIPLSVVLVTDFYRIGSKGLCNLHYTEASSPYSVRTRYARSLPGQRNRHLAGIPIRLRFRHRQTLLPVPHSEEYPRPG